MENGKTCKQLVREELESCMNKKEPQTLPHTIHKNKLKMSHGSKYKG